MFRRGFASLVLAGGLLALAGPTAMAATGGAMTADVYFAEGMFSDGQTDVDVRVAIGMVDGSAMRQLSVDGSSWQDITCKGKGKTKGGPGSILTSVSGWSDSPVVTIDRKLGTATASATITITTDTLNTCTGAETLVDSTVTVALNLHAVSGVTSTKTRVERTYPDGSKETINDKVDTRDGAGTVTYRGTAYATGFGGIGHEVFSDVITLPHH